MARKNALIKGPENMLEMFVHRMVCLHASILSNIILIVLRIPRK